MGALDGVKNQKEDDFVFVLEVLQCSMGGEPVLLPDEKPCYIHPASFKLFSLLNNEKDAPAWYVFRRISGLRRAHDGEKEEGVKVIMDFMIYHNDGLNQYLTRNELNDYPLDDVDAIDLFQALGVQETMHGFLRSEIVPFMTKHGLGSDRLNDLLPPPAESPAPVSPPTESHDDRLSAALVRIAELEAQLATGIPPYLDDTHRCYAPKLAAAIRAWEAVSCKPRLKKTPKQDIIAWLALNEHTHKLTKEAREHCGTVANWKPEGGAAKSSG